MSAFNIHFENDPAKREEITDHILHALPEWFGIEASITEYCKASRNLPMVIITDDEKPIGFCSLKVNYGVNCDLYVLGILPQYHRKGLGQKMIAFIETYCRENHIPYMSVKTLSERHPNPFYARTREFYKKWGFIAFEELVELWDEHNPCLLMIKQLT